MSRYNDSALLGLLAETALHPGTGQSTGFVDLPVAREQSTDYPVVRGSSLKGALRDMARDRGWVGGEDADEDGRIDRVFGNQEYAGGLLVSDARVALLPVRSLNTQYKWVTCPHILERIVRDRRRTGDSDVSFESGDFQELGSDNAIGSSVGDTLFLEERQYTTYRSTPDWVVELLEDLIPFEGAKSRLREQLVVLDDEQFAWFARYGLSINARNVLDDETKESENLWYEETLPPDTILYAVLGERGSIQGETAPIEAARGLFEGTEEQRESFYVQVGGNETVGQGWLAVEWYHPDVTTGGNR